MAGGLGRSGFAAKALAVSRCGRFGHMDAPLCYAALRLDVGGLRGSTGPAPALVRRIADSISSRSCGVRAAEGAPTQPSPCLGVRAPPMAPVTPGHAGAHPNVTEDQELAGPAATG